jgi:hypothetical protein
MSTNGPSHHLEVGAQLIATECTYYDTHGQEFSESAAQGTE